MFQSALIRRPVTGGSTIDAGLIAETLLFYNSVHVVADRGILHDLLQTIGADNLIALLEEKFLSMTYSRTISCVYTQHINYIPEYAFVSISASHANGPKLRHEDDLKIVIERTIGKSRKSKQILRKLLNVIEFREVHLGNSRDSNEVIETELSDPQKLKSYVKTFLRVAVPNHSLPPVWEFRPILKPDGSGKFFILTDLDFPSINRERQRIAGSNIESITPEHLLSTILSAKIDLDLSSNYLAEVITSDIASELIRVRFRELLARRDNSSRDIALFQDIILDDAYAIREAINSGEKNFTDFLKILRKAKRFKQWLADRNPDSKLLREYNNAVFADGWASSTPVKTVRYILTSAAGLVNISAGFAFGAADEFLVDRISKGWRPNQFIEGSVKRFIS